jgi:hypothetical protein
VIVPGVKGVNAGRATVRIVIYYAALLGAAALVVWRFPGFLDMVLMEQPPIPLGQGEITSTFSADVPAASAVPEGWASIWKTTVAVVGAQVIMVPVTWTYILIKRETGYEESVVHTLLILPVVVAGILIVVKGSLALAFSLAGIVAAVRFRTTLDDTKDAVYVFLAIGVGLAAGSEALGVAAALSVVFNVVNLTLWRYNFGNIYADQLHRTGGLGLGTAIAGPDTTRSAVGFGDRKVMLDLAPDSLDGVARFQQRMRQYLHEESDEARERKRYLALLVYTRDPAVMETLVDPLLDDYALRWQLAEVVPGADGCSALTYLVRLKQGVTETILVDAIRDGDAQGPNVIQAAEIRSLRKLAKG